jgi:hypothetical protein
VVGPRHSSTYPLKAWTLVAVGRQVKSPSPVPKLAIGKPYIKSTSKREGVRVLRSRTASEWETKINPELRPKPSQLQPLIFETRCGPEAAGFLVLKSPENFAQDGTAPVPKTKNQCSMFVDS